MRKSFVSVVLALVLVVVAATNTFATTNTELLEYLMGNHTVSGKTVSLTASQKVQVERYFTENPATDAEAAQIMAKGQELITLMETAGVSNPADLSKADKAKFMSIAQEGATVVGLTLVFNSNSVDVYKDGSLIGSGSIAINGTEKLAYTGNELNVALVVSSVAVIALASAFIAKKRLANAN